MTNSSINQSTTNIVSDPRWTSLVNRDKQADRQFVYSVRTTGVYCLPSCAARLARPENVEFHSTVADAERAGFRPCKRCKPDQASLRERQAVQIAAACRCIESSEINPTLKQLAEQAGLSLFHFHRLFKSVTGVTPAQYANAQRGSRVRASLTSTPTITEAIYQSGFNSSGRFYDSCNSTLGMTPTQFRHGGEGSQIYFAIGQSSLGAILVAQSVKGICAISIGDDPQLLLRELENRFPKATLIGGDSKYENLVAKVVGMINHPAAGFDLPLDVRGTAFQQRVWQALREIPLGSTATYSDIAVKIGMPAAARAVARACASNHIAVAVPCHRVVRNNGALSGYRWGVDRKQALLNLEALSVSSQTES